MRIYLGELNVSRKEHPVYFKETLGANLLWFLAAIVSRWGVLSSIKSTRLMNQKRFVRFVTALMTTASNDRLPERPFHCFVLAKKKIKLMYSDKRILDLSCVCSLLIGSKRDYLAV